MASFEDFDRKMDLVLKQQQEILAEVARMRSERKYGDRLTYTIKEVAEMTGLKYSTLHAKCKSGEIPSNQEKAKGTILITRDTLLQLEAKGFENESPIGARMNMMK